MLLRVAEMGPLQMSPSSSGRRSSWTALFLLALAIIPVLTTQSGNAHHVRAKREPRGTESLLTVEWEGIQSGDHPDSAIRGFIVEYRAEKEAEWNVHSGVIPYKGPNHQYRVQIPRLPTGISYFVRIKVLGDQNQVLVETPEIRARNEIVSIKCDADEITAPRDISVKQRGQFSVALSWLAPECGSVGEYQIELRGLAEGKFDVHHQTVAQPSASVTNLLPNTDYEVRVRAVDRSKTVGPWNSEQLTVTTKGEAPQSSEKIRVEYTSDTDARVRWDHAEEERLQQYEVVLVEFSGNDVKKIERTRVSPERDSFLFVDLSPNSEYEIGVVAYVDHEPRKVYRTSVTTAAQPALSLEIEPVIVKDGDNHYTIHWKKPDNVAATKFIVEFKPSNETRWVRLQEDREVRDDEESYSVSATELNNAFSVRVIVVDDEQRAVARTKEALVSGGGGPCEGAAGAPTDVRVLPSGTSITFTWEIPSCDQDLSSILGYEYMIWNQEDEPSDATSFTSKPAITVDDLDTNAVYSFKARSRLTNGHSSWSETVDASSNSRPEKENVYHQRIVLLPSKSYLVFTPLAEHQGRVSSVKVTYQLGTSKESKTIEHGPSFFECPKEAATARDLCFDLSDLKFGRQYTTDVLYRVDSESWVPHGSPLYFLLVEADSDAPPSKPNNLQIVAKDESTLLVRWLPPLGSRRVALYEVNLRDTANNTFREIVQGNVYSTTFNNVDVSGISTISVRAINNHGKKSHPLSEIFVKRFSHVESLTARNKVAIRDVEVDETTNNVIIKFTVEGPIHSVRVFKLEQKNIADNRWHQLGSYINADPRRLHYDHVFPREAVTSGAFVRVAAVSKDSKVLTHSHSVEVKLTCPSNTLPPSNVNLRRITEQDVVLRWHYPTQNIECGLYFIISGHVDDSSISVTVDGLIREHHFHLVGQSWTLTVTAVSKSGTGPASVPVNLNIGRNALEDAAPLAHQRRKRSICDPRTDFWCRDEKYSTDKTTEQRGALVSTPTVTTQNNEVVVSWKSQGNGRGVFGYRVQYRPDQSPGWIPYGQLVPYVGDDQEYTQKLTGLSVGTSYQVHVQALDRNSYVLFTSGEIAAKSTCTAPSHPPSHVRSDAPDPRHVRIAWATPPQNTWGCNAIEIELQVDEPRGIPPVKVDGRQTSHVFDSPNEQQWSVRVRVVNSAGQSAWAPAVTVRSGGSSAAAESIEGPFVSHIQGSPRISWRAREGTERDQVAHFQVEWRSQTEPNWHTHQNSIPYAGWQRTYSIDLGDLPKGHTYQVRVKAIDPNRGTASTSPSVTIETTSQCSAPRRQPSNVAVTPLGPTKIRLSWQPIAEAEWNCDSLWYVVKYSSPESQGFKNVSGGVSEAIFDSKPHTQWRFEVQAVNPAGATQWTRPANTQSLSTAPGPVSDLIVYPLSAEAVQLSWRPPQNPNGVISGYEITYQVISKGMCENAPEAPITITSEQPSYTITGLKPHSKYRIGVAARTALAGERVSREIQTEQSVPTAGPAHVRVDNARESSADLSWHAPPCVHTNGDILEYEYEVTAFDPYSNVPRIQEQVRTTRVQLRTLIPNTRYKVRVRASTNRGAGPWSQDVPFQTAAPQAPAGAPPQARVINTGPTEANVVWQTTPQNANYYDKFRCQYRQRGEQQPQERQFPAYSPCQQEVIRRQQLPPSTPQRQTHCGRIDNLKPDETYDFQVSARVRDEQQWSDWTPPQETHIGQGPVQIARVYKVGSTPRSLHFAWTIEPTDQIRCTSYRITVVPVDRTEQPRIYTVDRNTMQYRVDGLRPSTAYSVTVEASAGNRWGPGVTVEMSTDSDQITGLAQAPRIIEEKATSITISWDVPAPITCSNFLVEYRLDNGVWQESPRRVPCGPGRRSYTATVDNLPTNSVIDLRVRVVSTSNQPSNPSPEARGRTKCSAPDSPPQAVRADSPSTNEVRVSWARPAKNTWNCDQLNIEIGYRVGNGPEKIVPVPGDRTDYVFPSEPNTRWVIRVRASNQVGASPWSAEQSITTRQGAPAGVRDLRVTPLSPNEMRVQWSAPAEQRGSIVGYDISYRLKHRLSCPDEEPRDVSRDFVTVYNHKDLDYTLTGLLPNSLYEVKVRARTTELGPEETREAATFQQPPSAPPLNLQNTYALERSLSFQWEPVDCSQRHGEIVNYEYEILGQDDWAKLERQIANTSDGRVTIDGLTPFTKYVMRVKAYNSIGGGPNTENLDVMTAKANAPLPPQDLVVTQEGTDFFVVSWLPPYPPYGPHDKYKLRYQLLNTNDWKEIDIAVNDPRLKCPAVSPRFCFNITGLDNGQQYRVQVSAHIEGGSYGPWSSAIIANTLQILPDAPRAIELIEKTDHSLHIRWIPPVDPHGHITQYRINIKPSNDPNAQAESYNVDHPTLQYLLDNLQPETTYNISLSAGTKRGFGPEIWTQYTTDAFKVPTLVNAPIVTAEGAHILNVQWNGVVDTKNRVQGYIIEIRTSDNPAWTEFGGIVRHETGKRTYNSKLEGLDADTLYFVRIKVVDRRQRISAASPEAQARTGCAAPSSPPTNIALNSPSPRQVRVNWQSPNKNSWACSAIRYRIEYSNGTGPAQTVELPGSSIDHFFDSLPNTKWKIRVRTENDAGTSPWSNELQITTADGAPGPISDLNARPTGPTTGEVTWRPPSNPNGDITGYTLTYQLKSIGECGVRSAKPITIHSNDPRVELKELIPDATYEVSVVAHTTQPGAASKTVILTTEESEPTGAPKNLRATSITSNRADLIWNEIECEKRNGKIIGYEYELETDSLWGQNVSATTNTHRVSFDALSPFTEYRARVRGQNSKGDGPFSEWTTFKTLPAAPGAPTDLAEEQRLPHAVEISFVAPYPPNGVIDYYKIRHTPSEQFNYKEVRVPVSELECSVNNRPGKLCYRVINLEPEQDYDIQVAAHSENGDWSEWSETLSIKTDKQNIPVLEQGLEIDFVKSTSIGVKWEGLPADQAEHIVGYVLEYKSEDDENWQEYNGVVRHRTKTNNYKLTIRDLIESTEYFFRIRVVGKNDKRGGPGPEVKAITKCGKPDEPPQNVKIVSEDFETVKITWENPDEETWRCDNVEFVVHYVNTTSKGTIAVPGDGPSELVLETIPGTKWEVKMRTQTVEDGAEPQHSTWSNRGTLVTQSLPGEIFVKVEPKGPHTAEVNWDLPEDDQDWNYGVDITYKLTKLGDCVEKDIEDAEPIVLENVQNKQVLLENLAAGSEYEIIVTPRRPPGLPDSVQAKKTVRKFTTDDAVPTGAPQNARVDAREDVKLGFSWDPPPCAEQNGPISQYEYELVGQDEWNEGTREGVSPRTKAEIADLMPGSLYRFRVRAFTSEGPGPWSDPIDARTTGSELGPPRELTAVLTRSTSIQLTWLPPYPERSQVTAYKLRYSPRADDSNPVEIEISGDELSCAGFTNPIISKDNLCTTVTGLEPSTTYRFAVQAQSASGTWGPWSSDYFSTTRKDDNESLGGSLKLVTAGHDNLKVKWTPPAVIGDKIDKYEVFISVASEHDKNPKKSDVNGRQTDYHFKTLNPVTQYNVTVQGLEAGKKLWFISGVFATTDFAEGLLSWLGPPTDLHLIEKSDTMIHVDWQPPEIFDPTYRDLLTHYRVTITPLDTYTLQPGQPQNYTVMVPGNSIKFEGLTPETIYNITVQGGTNNGYGEVLWGTYSTLSTGQSHVLRLKNRTPTTLTVEWDPVWGTQHRGYTLTAKSLASIYHTVRLNTIKTFDVDATNTDFVIRGLDPATTYNVTLQPKDQNDGAWGVYSTLPPGWFLPKNLKHCDKTQYATSMSWEPVELDMASHYQVRYIRINQNTPLWTEESERKAEELLCPKDPCNRLCYLVFNLENNPDEYVFQVRAKVDGVWNRWKTAGRLTVSEPPEIKEACCIVPPPYMVENIGAPGTWWEIDIRPAPTEKNITRYYVVVDERDPPGDSNWTELTDKVTAHKRKTPYYVAGSFSVKTLTEPMKVRLGDGKVIGGYLNYPLDKGKKYNYEIYTKWLLNNEQPVVARLRVEPYEVSGYPWWWLAALLLALLLLTLLCCLLAWCFNRHKRRRSARYVNGQDVPLLADSQKLGATDSRARGDFEDGYSKGYREASRVGSGTAARQRLDDNYGSRDDRFAEGYSKGLRDAGMTNMTTSMHNLAQRPGSNLGYSAGYMQGFRDGNSGVFGDRISNQLLKRLEDQYPNEEEFRQGYIDGFKEGTRSGGRFEDSRRLQQSLTELTERLTSLEKTKGDEIHSTKIYHVYNQHPEFVGYSATGEQLAKELEELTSTSRRSTLRRHYTPGDYLKYAGEDGYNSLGQNRRSLSASALGRDSSATAERTRYASGTSYLSRASALDRQGTDTYSKKYNYRSRSDIGSPRRYASQTLLDGTRPGPTTPHARRDALHSLQRELDNLSRSPDASAARHGGYSSDTGYLNDTIRSRARTATGYSNYDYDTYQSAARSSEQRTTTSTAATAATTATSGVTGSTAANITAGGANTTTTSGVAGSGTSAVSSGQQVPAASTSTTVPIHVATSESGAVSVGQEDKESHHHQATTSQQQSSTTHNWPDDLIDIVAEPMSQTLDRMRRFSNSLSNVDRDEGVKEQVEERYQRSYKEEFHSSGGQR
uniref:Fibronectin type III domain protein n=1 Tax=Panagrellus redivivus TaxID=6233 RepID=A0A7E4VM27_PANRE